MSVTPEPGDQSQDHLRQYYQQWQIYSYSTRTILRGRVDPEENQFEMERIKAPMTYLVTRFTGILRSEVLDEQHARAILQNTMDTGFMEKTNRINLGELPDLIRTWEWRYEAYQIGLGIQQGEVVEDLNQHTTLFHFILRRHEARLYNMGRIRLEIITDEAEKRTYQCRSGLLEWFFDPENQFEAREAIR